MNVAVDPFDLASIFLLRDMLEGLDGEGLPTLRTVTPAPSCRSVAVMPGSFNPPTVAHLLLAERALSDGYDCVVFLLARKTAGKELQGMIPEDRLLALRAAGNHHLIVGVCSHGLYADQAEAVARAFPGAEIGFLVGSDKVPQIFEDRWYPDRDAALSRLFSHASLVVAPRSDQADEMRATLESPRNARWAGRVEVLRLHPAVGDLSSTRVRGLLHAGADPSGLVPVGVAGVLEAIRAFAPPVVVGSEEVDAYEARARLIELLWASRGHAAEHVDLRALTRIAISPGERGAGLRALLAGHPATTHDVFTLSHLSRS